jgi:hypothetical protein
LLPTIVGGLLGAAIVLLVAGDFPDLRRLFGTMANSYTGLGVRLTSRYSPPPSRTPGRRLWLGLASVVAILSLGASCMGFAYLSSLTSGPGYRNCIGQATVLMPATDSNRGRVYQPPGVDGQGQWYTEEFRVSAPWTIQWTKTLGSLNIDLYDATVRVPAQAPFNQDSVNSAGNLGRITDDSRITNDSREDLHPGSGTYDVKPSGLFCLTISSGFSYHSDVDVNKLSTSWRVMVMPSAA